MKLKARVRLGNKLFLKKKKIGILGGTFDPPHEGHLEISKQAKKKFKLTYITWAITEKNPFKSKSKPKPQSNIVQDLLMSGSLGGLSGASGPR